jgi:hypothetical protein
MEMKENNQKKMLLSVLGVAILVVAVVGISFAAFSTSFSSKANSVTTGTIMVTYNESGNAINITDAMPLSDSNGIAQTDAFNFSVSTKADSALTVPYEVNLLKVTTGSPEFTSMEDSQVKVYLTKGGSAVTETTATGKLVSALANSTLTSGAKVLHSTSDVFTDQSTSTKTTNYVLRMWIAQNVNYDDVSGKEYHAKVNVESRVTPINS